MPPAAHKIGAKGIRIMELYAEIVTEYTHINPNNHTKEEA